MQISITSSLAPWLVKLLRQLEQGRFEWPLGVAFQPDVIPVNVENMLVKGILANNQYLTFPYHMHLG